MDDISTKQSQLFSPVRTIRCGSFGFDSHLVSYRIIQHVRRDRRSLTVNLLQEVLSCISIFD